MSAQDDNTLTGGGKETPQNSQPRRRPSIPQNDPTLTSGKKKNISQTPQEDQTMTARNKSRRIPGNHTITFSSAPQQTRTEGTLTQARGAVKGKLVDKVNWEVGDVVDGRFEVIEIIGQGGMGIVYRVNHREWKLDMAVKMPLTYLVADEASKARFIREAQTWVDLGLHPNIVQCWYVLELGGIPRVFMDYIDGGSLKDWLTEGKVKPGEWDKILDLIIQACDGLGYAHELGVEVHRDVKPGNLLLTEEGDLLVTDFGIVKRAGMEEIEQNTSTNKTARIEEPTITETGSELGTPQYGAPEQWGGAKNADKRADIYALGGILFELCCGRRAFDDGSHAEPVHVLIGRHLSTPAPDPRQFNAAVPESLAKIMLTCLEKDPAKRPASMLELRNELTRIHREIVGKNYRRMIPQAADLRSDALNNRAVSFLDLDREQEALISWDEALKLDAYHPESLYNRALLQWRECKISDDDVIRQLGEAKHVTKRSNFYLGFIHMERAAAEEAEKEFLEALNDQELAENTPLWRELGDARFAQEKYSEALEAYKKALELVPKDLESLDRQVLAQKMTRKRDDGRIFFCWQRCCSFFGSGHEGGVTSVDITPDGQFIVSGGEDKTVRVWNSTTRECLWTLKGHEDHVLCIAVTSDGKYAVSGSRDKTVRLWELSTGKCLRILRGHTDWVNVVAVTPDGRRAVSGSRDKTFRQWEIPTGKCFWTSERFNEGVNALVIISDGRYGLSGHEEENLYRWNLITGKLTERKYYASESFDFGSLAITALGISKGGELAVSGNQDATLQLWNVHSGQELQKLKGGHDEKITAAAIMPDNRFIISGSEDAALCLWDLEKNGVVQTFDGHKDSVTAMRMAQNGQLLVSGSRDATLRLWNPTAREFLCTLWGTQGHTEAVTAVAIGLHGRFIVSASQDMSVRLWDMNTAKCLRSYDGHVKDVTCVAVTPDGRLAISGSRDSSLLLWELGTGRCLRTFRGHTKDVTAVAISPNGQFAVSGSEDNTLRLWNLKTEKLFRIFKGHTDYITSAAITPDGRFVVSGSQDKTLRLWNLSTGKCIRTFTGHEESVKTVSVLSDGQFIVSGGGDNTLRLWRLSTAKCIRTFHGHKEGINAVVATPDRRFVISGSDDSTMRLWELATAKCLRTFTGHTDQVSTIAITSTGQFVISGSRDATLRLWDLDPPEAQRYEAALQVCRQQNHGEVQLSTERFRRQMAWAKVAWENGKATAAYRYLTQARSIPGYERAPESLKLNAFIGTILPRKHLRGDWELWSSNDHAGVVTSVAITPDGRSAVSGSTDMSLRSWELETGTCLKLFDGHWLAVTSIAITPDGRFVVSGSEDTALRLWDIVSAQCLRTYEGHEQDVIAVAISPHGRFIVSGGLDGTIRLWNPSTAQCLRTFKGHRNGVMAVTITPDQRYIVSGGGDSMLRLWDRANGKCLRTFKGHKNWVTAVAVTPDGRYLVSGSNDRTLRLWNLETTRCLSILRGHEDEVTSITLTPDGRFAFSGSQDKTIQLWDLSTGQNLWVFRGYKQGVRAVAISPNGRFLFSGDHDSSVRLGELDWELDTSEATPLVGDKDLKHPRLIKRLTSFFQTHTKS